ncbi:MAG: hypothetical protein EHM79_02165 [Geobacter sp.]|nr:MAG: hypothetical protein EHM79_02165 [Geobacter sp.]
MANFFTNLVAGVLQFKAAHFNTPLAELDKQLTYQQNRIIHCDGDLSYNKATGVFSWSATLRILFNSAAGLAIQNTVAAGSVTLADNEFCYVILSETNDAVLTVAKAAVTTSAASNFLALGRVVLGYRNTTSDEFYAAAIRQKWSALYDPATVGNGIILTGYSETEVSVDATSGTANLDYSAGNVFVVSIAASTDTTLTFTNLPAAGKACSATVRLKMAGTVPSSITVQGATIDTTDVTSGGRITVEMTRIDSVWDAGWHHAS